MKFIIIERFDPTDARAIYQRFRERGRMLPDGLRHLESWVSSDMDRCFQLMECEDSSLIQECTVRWNDLVDFEVVPVISSDDASAIAFGAD